MGCGISDISEKGAFWCLFGMVSDIGRRFITNSVREEVTFREFIVLDTRVIACEGIRFPEVRGTGNDTIVFIKPTLAGPTVFGTIGSGVARDMPFAAHIRAIPLGSDSVGNSDTPVIEVPTIAFKSVVAHHVSDSGLVRM